MEELRKEYFSSADGLQITADFYEISNPEGFILLCQRSHCNLAEYRETAPKFTWINVLYLTLAPGKAGMMLLPVHTEHQYPVMITTSLAVILKTSGENQQWIFSPHIPPGM
jgi:hypothetical protein